ncbi:SDR family oxidoreductase [Maribacter aurantiacus]|uniref:SDR family oxidoreductase n=1 Tax=Maribacter aurantiacus TaxID=1882343 RepID=A0A5R8M773_9FLAO|nr:SDR family oxidoreductase [Maribacter aurantiacus]TLF45393.1 SDR family oxidoreductase [Maribacter aurantiacus]
MNKVIGVIGCGWLGLPLAKSLVTKGYEVKGTTTSKEKLETLSNVGIAPFRVWLSENEIQGNIQEFLNGTDTLVVNIPPKLRGKGPKENYVRKIALLVANISTSAVREVLFVSSTSVYGDGQGEVDEETLPVPTSEAGKQLLETEKLLTENPNFEATILRFGGLIGPDRHPVHMLSGRTNLSGGNAPVNLIHLEDCIGIITSIIQNNLWGEIINGVYPVHPTKKSYYTQKAQEKGLNPPSYNTSETENLKKITSCNPFITKNYVFSASI